MNEVRALVRACVCADIPIMQFTLESVHKAGAVVELNKLKWFNQQHLRRIVVSGAALGATVLLTHADPKRLVKDLLPQLQAKHKGVQLDEAYIATALQVLSERLVLTKDFLAFDYLFRDPDLDSAEVRTRAHQSPSAHTTSRRASFTTRAGTPRRTSLRSARRQHWRSCPSGARKQSMVRACGAVLQVRRRAAAGTLDALSKELALGHTQVYHPLRLLLTGSSVGVGLPDTMELLGRAVVLARLKKRVPAAQ